MTEWTLADLRPPTPNHYICENPMCLAKHIKLRNHQPCPNCGSIAYHLAVFLGGA